MATDLIGIHIINCNFKNTLFKSPRITVSLVDITNGQFPSKDIEPVSTSQISEPRQTKNFLWNETLIINFPIQAIMDNKQKYIIFFDISDYSYAKISSIFIPNLASKNDRKRIAWAFFKPCVLDNTDSTNKQIQLQLFKVRRNCSTSHQTCDIHHLFSAHKRKKIPGVVTISLQSTQSTDLTETPHQQSNKEEPIIDLNSTQIKLTDPNLFLDVQLDEWHRLPTQSCKVPTALARELHVSRQGASCVKFSHKGLHIACGTSAKIVVFEVMSGSESVSFLGHSGLVYELDWSMDDSHLLSVSADGTCVVWQVFPSLKHPVHVLPHPSYVYCGKWIDDSMLATGCVDRALRVWRKTSQSFDLIAEIIAHDGFVSALEVVNDKHLITGDSLGTILMWSYTKKGLTSTRRLQLKEISDSVIDSIYMHPGQRRFVVAARGRGAFMVDIATAVCCHVYSAPVNCFVKSTAALSPCGNLLFAFDQNQGIHVWDFETARHIATYHSLFPALIGQTAPELSGHIDYHPRGHMAAFAIFAVNYPVKIVQYDKVNTVNVKFDEKVAVDRPVSARKVGTSFDKVDDGKSSTVEDKLAAVVREMDRVLAAKRELTRALKRKY